jgi:repressor LexA
MKALTTRQQEVFDLIRDHISQTGMPPTRAEIAQRWGSVLQTRRKNT